MGEAPRKRRPAPPVTPRAMKAFRAAFPVRMRGEKRPPPSALSPSPPGGATAELPVLDRDTPPPLPLKPPEPEPEGGVQMSVPVRNRSGVRVDDEPGPAKPSPRQKTRET